MNYTSKIAELRKLKQVYSNASGAEDSDNKMKDTQMLESKVRGEQELLKRYSNMIEHIETLCNSGACTNDTKHVEQKPINAKYWNKLVKHSRD